MDHLKLVARMREKEYPGCSSYVVLSGRRNIIFIEEQIFFICKDEEMKTGEAKGWKS